MRFWLALIVDILLVCVLIFMFATSIVHAETCVVIEMTDGGLKGPYCGASSIMVSNPRARELIVAPQDDEQEMEHYVRGATGLWVIGVETRAPKYMPKGLMLLLLTRECNSMK